MNPYLWVMCNDSEEGRRLPSLMALKAIEPNDSSMEVVLVDRYGDTRLMELENRAQELYYASESTLVLVEKLAWKTCCDLYGVDVNILLCLLIELLSLSLRIC